MLDQIESVVRNLILLYCLIHFDDFQDIDIGLRSRNEELCEPVLQMFFNAKREIKKEIVSMLKYFLKPKCERREDIRRLSLMCSQKNIFGR